jgi:hypothetical protein
MNFCTLSDKNYLLKGLALYESLKTTTKDFTLHWLCMDEETFNKLIAIKKKNQYFANIKPYSLSGLEYHYAELRRAKQNPPSKYGTQYSQYCWCMTPWFMNYLLQFQVTSGEYLMYIDSDIYFYGSPLHIISAMHGKPIGIHTHRFSTMEERETGNYNVGVVVFKSGDEAAMKWSKMWKGWLLDPKNEYYEKYGTCGDQKYMDLCAVMMGTQNVSVFDVEGDILHYAPWCTHNPKHQKPLFFHFSHFNHNLEAGTWTDSNNGEWKPASEPDMKPYYENYFEAIKEMSKFI